MKVSFSGIYDIRFPQNTKIQEIEKKYFESKEFFDQHIKSDNKSIIGVHMLKDPKDKQLPIIRVVTPVDNPLLLTALFGIIDKKVAQQYIDKTKINLQA